MTQPTKEKSLIELAKEHMDKAGADPAQGVSVPDAPSTSAGERTEIPAEDLKFNTPKEEPKEVVKDAFDGTVASAVSDLLKNITGGDEWITLNLPSRGKSYRDHEGVVSIKAFTYREEKKLRSIKKVNQANNIIKSLFGDCVKGLDYDSMTLEDKNFVLFKLREISYGDKYVITAVCPDCSAENNLNLLISEIPVEYAAEDFEEPLEITLPDSDQVVKYVNPRAKDEPYMEDMVTLTENLWRFALSVGAHSDKNILRQFFEQTTVRDISFFRENLSKSHYGFTKKVAFDCANCGETTETFVPFNESFFSVS
tara:strand:+ start:1545 stop:2477 length:933 start_codon:yes stop_codon:yes gene_type:complete